MKKRIYQIEFFLKYPHEVQSDWFRKLIFNAQNTEWGKRYGYHSINSYEDFKGRVPLQDYESLKPFILDIKQGKHNVLWPGEVKWFAKSSGTSNDKSKFIPITQESLEECHFKGGKDLLALYFNSNPESKLFGGKTLSLGGSHKINSFSNDSYYGDLSSILMQNLPFWIQMFQTPDISVSLMDEWESKIQKMAEITKDANVTCLAGVPSWTMVLLKRVLELTGKKTIHDVWPELELFVHGGVSFTPYRSQFEQLIQNPKMNYLETYNASEGFFGIQDQNINEGMLLMLDYGIFYEFIPMSAYVQGDLNAISLDQVELNVNYAVVITSNGGLWRYLIGDTVMFTSVNPYRIKVSGRTTGFINAFGEELMISNAEKALNIACSETGASIRDYTAAPVYMSNRSEGAHEWLIEFSHSPDNLDQFVSLLDEALKKLNSDYEAKRYNNMALSKPMLRAVPEKTFYNWLKSKNKLGGQHKVPRLNNDRRIIDEILQQIETV